MGEAWWEERGRSTLLLFVTPLPFSHSSLYPVGARVIAHLERDGEVAEALGEDPHDGVGEPDDDGEAGELAVDGAALAAARLGGLGPRLAEGEDDVQEPGHAEEPPDPLDVADGEGAESAAGDHEDCGWKEWGCSKRLLGLRLVHRAKESG